MGLFDSYDRYCEYWDGIPKKETYLPGDYGIYRGVHVIVRNTYKRAYILECVATGERFAMKFKDEDRFTKTH